jgi:lysozyme
MDIYAQLKRDEGIRRFPYFDINGHTSIGVGRNLSAEGLSDDEIEYLLGNDVKFIYNTLDTRLPWFTNLDPVRQGALTNMAFNLGFAGLEKFPDFLSAMAKGQWQEASVRMLNSEWATQVGDRAKRLSQQILTGNWV